MKPPAASAHPLNPVAEAPYRERPWQRLSRKDLVAMWQRRMEDLRWRLQPERVGGSQQKLLEQWRREEIAQFRGWDFSYLEDRLKIPEPRWNYNELARSMLAGSNCTLDMATGGGEKYRDLLTPLLPGRYFACEGYRKNLPVARANLGDLGVEVRWSRSVRQLPFNNACFDLVLNRHGGFDAVELLRILAPGGMFLTQQVAEDNLADLCACFGHSHIGGGRDLDALQQRLLEAGFAIERADHWSDEMVFRDVGALVYFLRVVPWLVPNFSVPRFYPELLSLHERCQRDGQLQFTISRQLFLARKHG